jgi:hypothetical protein
VTFIEIQPEYQPLPSETTQGVVANLMEREGYRGRHRRVWAGTGASSTPGTPVGEASV